MTIEIFNRRGDVTPVVIVADDTINLPAPIGTTSINVIGRNILDYGDEIGQNFQWMLENFADINPPEGGQRGQLWYDVSNSTKPILRIFGETSGTWDPITKLSDDLTPTVRAGVNLDSNNNRIINVANPISSGDAANKQYVDDELLNSLSIFGTSFISLDDTPATYFGNANNILTVNSSVDGLEFKTLTFTDMGDTPALFDGAAGQVVRVNNTTTALEFSVIDTIDITSSGNLNMGGFNVENLGDPNSGDDALNRSFADNRYLRDTSGNSNGFVVRTSSTGETIARSITASGGIVVVNGSGVSGNPVISHSDTSSQSSVNNSGNTVIQDITLDTFGHITSISSKTLAAAASSTPTGGVISFAGSVAPSGWLLCNGDAVSQTTFATLFSAISTTYGVGGAGTFRVPNLNGRMILGKNNGGVGTGTTNRSLGVSGGEEDVILTSTQLPIHSHILFNNQTQVGSDTDAISAPTRTLTANRTKGGDTEYFMGTDNANPNKEPTVGVSGKTGSNLPHENLSPFLVLNSIIKT